MDAAVAAGPLEMAVGFRQHHPDPDCNSNSSPGAREVTVIYSHTARTPRVSESLDHPSYRTSPALALIPTLAQAQVSGARTMASDGALRSRCD